MRAVKPRTHPLDRDVKRRNSICSAFRSGEAPSEIAPRYGLTRREVAGIVARAGLSRGDKPSDPRRFGWQEEEAAETALLPAAL